MSETMFISLWAGDLDCARELPNHLAILYGSIGHSRFQRDPEVCEELELVPIGELLEPYSLSEVFLVEAVSAAEQQSLRLASLVVAVYTHEPPKSKLLSPPGCGLRYLGTFPES